jgi:hypothetical protein
VAIDYCVGLECDPKRHFGKGDCGQGSDEILARLKSQSRAAALRRLAQAKGKDPSQITVEVQAPDREGKPVSKEVTLAELEAEAKPLADHAAACETCPVNLLRRAYGCFGVINYPISQAAEAWLLGRLQPPDTIGAHMCMTFMSESGVTGERIRQMRGAGFFEARRAGKVTLKKGFLTGVSVSADQLLEAILMAGSPLSPVHCFGVLLWLGAISIQGKIPGGAEDQQTLSRLVDLKSCDEKQAQTALELGPEPRSNEEAVFRGLMEALYRSWLHGVPMLISG